MAYLLERKWEVWNGGRGAGGTVRNLPYFTAAELAGRSLPAIGAYALTIQALAIILAWIRGAVVGAGAMQTAKAAMEEQQWQQQQTFSPIFCVKCGRYALSMQALVLFLLLLLLLPLLRVYINNDRIVVVVAAAWVAADAIFIIVLVRIWAGCWRSSRRDLFVVCCECCRELMLFFRMLHQAHFSLCCFCRLLFVLNFHIHECECDWECNFFDFLRARIVNCVWLAQFETHSMHTRSYSFNMQMKITNCTT